MENWELRIRNWELGIGNWELGMEDVYYLLIEISASTKLLQVH